MQQAAAMTLLLHFQHSKRLSPLLAQMTADTHHCCEDPADRLSTCCNQSPAYLFALSLAGCPHPEESPREREQQPWVTANRHGELCLPTEQLLPAHSVLNITFGKQTAVLCYLAQLQREAGRKNNESFAELQLVTLLAWSPPRSSWIQHWRLWGSEPDAQLLGCEMGNAHS